MGPDENEVGQVVEVIDLGEQEEISVDSQCGEREEANKSEVRGPSLT